MLNTIIQIILALFLILIMAFIAYSIYDNEYIKSINIFNTNKKETKIFNTDDVVTRQLNIFESF